MNILVVGLIYGSKDYSLIYKNVENAGYTCTPILIDKEGIANALNDGIDMMKALNMDAIAYLSNDIEEPEDWLLLKKEALESYPAAGIVASSLDNIITEMKMEYIISNWLISKETIDKIGYFNEEYFPYGPIDLDYIQRCHAEGIATYYTLNCKANHINTESNENKYGYSKSEMVQKYWQNHKDNFLQYHLKQKETYLNRIK